MHQLTHSDTDWKTEQYPVILACDNWHDPRNVGMAFRLADAFGVQEIWLGGDTPCPPNKKITKTARSTSKWVNFQSFPDLEASLRQAKLNGHTVWGIEITSTSKSIHSLSEIVLPQPLILVLGAESKGISDNILTCLDDCYHIPMVGKNTSLNVATALSIALYEVGKNIKIL